MQNMNIITASKQNAINQDAVVIDSIECDINLENNKVESCEGIFIAEWRTGRRIIGHSFNGVHKISNIMVRDIITA